MTVSAPPRLLSLPPDADVLAWAASTLVQQHRAALPDLSHITLIVPAAAQIPRLRKLLLAQAGGALLGPAITTLGGFGRERSSRAALSALDCKLLLAQALQRHPDLFSGQDRWALANALFGLFEELSAATPELADDVGRFLGRIERGYGSARLAQISQEARAAHLLWQAYLHDTGRSSPAVAHLQALTTALATLAPDERVYLIGHDHFSGAEARILRDALARQSLTLWLQGPDSGRGRQTFAALLQTLAVAEPVVAFERDPAPDPRARILDGAFADDGLDLRQRAAAIDGTVPGLTLVIAGSPEHEARVVDLAVRRALLAGQRDIAVVTQDRRLARRLRALLERAGVPLQDEAAGPCRPAPPPPVSVTGSTAANRIFRSAPCSICSSAVSSRASTPPGSICWKARSTSRGSVAVLNACRRWSTRRSPCCPACVAPRSFCPLAMRRHNPARSGPAT
jgi:ATP-dependent helicase/nuclease subunit B